jgi:hypothetical protein
MYRLSARSVLAAASGVHVEGIRDGEMIAGASERHVHQPPFFLELVLFLDGAR